ncbi:superoxide dismutase [Cytidiella melzeri]|nr:superoxide dismutase [Cytidiella melzeri]
MDTYNAKPKQQSRPVLLILGTLAVVSVFYFFLKPSTYVPTPVVTKAVTVLKGDSGASGVVVFEQSTPLGAVTITGDLKGLDSSALRGFHVHVSGDLSGGCASAGSHFNPFNENHGAPQDSHRHVGDLGNIQSDAKGNSKFTIQDKLITLNGPLSIIGRSVVLHAGTDDLGLGGNEESLKTGNAGGRAACGVIGLA